MAKINESIINFAVYENAVEYYGMAEVTLPEITNLTAEVTGAGISSTFESVVLGHLEAMSLIDEVNSEIDRTDEKTILNATERKLMKFSASDIVDWHNIKSLYMDLAYRNNLWAACAATHSHCSDDGFIDFRSWLISQGKEVYMSALHDPDTLAGVDIPEGKANFERYGYIQRIQPNCLKY